MTLAFHSNGGSASSQIIATTDKDGKFSVGVPKLGATKIRLIINCDGFGGFDTKPMTFGPAQNGIVKVDTITLKPGCSIRAARGRGQTASPCTVRLSSPVITMLHGRESLAPDPMANAY